MDPKKLAYQKTTGTVNKYLVHMHLDITIELLVMQSSKGPDMLSHRNTRNLKKMVQLTSTRMQAHSRLPGRLRQ